MVNQSNKFDFSEALCCLKCGQVVQLTLNDITRVYFMDDEGNIVCRPRGKAHLQYVVKEMYSDSILSTDWELGTLLNN